MRSKTLLLLTTFFILFLFVRTSCTKKCPCGTGGIDISLIGFNASETDTMVLRSFTKGSGFSIVKDSVVVSAANSGYYPSHDTLNISIRYRSPGIENNADYELFFPASNASYKLSDFAELAKEETCMQRNLGGCRNSIIAVNVNNQLRNTILPVPNAIVSYLYIRK